MTQVEYSWPPETQVIIIVILLCAFYFYLENVYAYMCFFTKSKIIVAGKRMSLRLFWARRM